MPKKPSPSKKKTIGFPPTLSHVGALLMREPLRKELDRLISRKIHDGATYLMLAIAFTNQLRRLLVNAAAVQELDRAGLRRMASQLRRVTSRRVTAKSPKKRAKAKR